MAVTGSTDKFSYSGWPFTWFSTSKAMDVVAKALSNAGSWTRIANPAYQSIADGFKTMGDNVQHVFKAMTLPQALTKLALNSLNMWIVPADEGEKNVSARFAYYPGRPSHFAIEAMHNTAEVLSKLKGTISLLNFCKIALVAEKTFKKISIAADFFLLASATWKVGEYTMKLFDSSEQAKAEFTKNLTDLIFQVTLVAFATLGIITAFALAPLPVWAFPVVGALNILTAVYKAYQEDGSAEKKAI